MLVFQSLENFDFGELEQVIEELTQSSDISFTEMVQQLMNGAVEEYGIKEWLFSTLLAEWRANQAVFLLMLGLGVTAAVFYQIASAFFNKQIAETSFYLTYLVFLASAAAGFELILETVETSIRNLQTFMQVLIPCFFAVVSLSFGSAMAVGYYESALLVMGLENQVLLKLVLPVIKLTFLLQMVNHLTKEEMISKLAEYMGQAGKWCMKAMLALVLGMNVLEGLMLPAVDKVKLNSLEKAVALVPGVGSSAAAIAGILAGTGSLVRNAVGVAACLFLFVIISMPLLQTVVFILLYKLLAVCLEPVSDTRLTGAVEEISREGGMLLQALMTAMLLFLITIAVVCAVTGR